MEIYSVSCCSYGKLKELSVDIRELAFDEHAKIINILGNAIGKRLLPSLNGACAYERTCTAWPYGACYVSYRIELGDKKGCSAFLEGQLNPEQVEKIGEGLLELKPKINNDHVATFLKDILPKAPEIVGAGVPCKS